MENLINIRNLEKRYDDFLLSAVNLTVEAGSVVGFVGSNGAGKTTTIKALLGLIRVDGGSIELFGKPIVGQDGKAANRAAANHAVANRAAANHAVANRATTSANFAKLKSRIGVVFDTCAFPNTCRVSDIGRIGRAAYPTWSRARWDELCHTFDLAPKKKVTELSRGMGMKLTLAFALSHDPDLLILDEATAGLDPLARESVLDILRDFMTMGKRGILMSTHITSDLEKIADKVVCIDAGRIVFDMPKDAITDEAGVAHLRANQLETVLQSPLLSAENASAAAVHDANTRPICFIRNNYGIDMLVPDRFSFARAFPDIPVDSATIENYMTFILKGDAQ